MSSKFLKIGFIGGGKMAQALAKGFIAAGYTRGSDIVSSSHPSDAQSVQAFTEMEATTTFDNIKVVKESDVLIVAVKPALISSVLTDIKKAENIKTDKLFLSIAMGITIKELERRLPSDSRVVRVMPNTPALVKSGTSVFVRSTKATENDVAVTKALFGSVGTCEEVNESIINAVTGVSGSGPAYVYVLIESLADGGVKMGLPRDLSYRLAAQTVLGAGQMVRDTKLHPGILKDNVTSPAGSTATALHYLEEKGFRAAVIGAVEAATRKCMQVSDS